MFNQFGKNLCVVIFFAFVANNLMASQPLPLPRFASLRASKINWHIGPGGNYPISWLYKAQSMPVEIVAEFDTWRQVRDFQGTEGWVHKSLLSGKRHVIVVHQTQQLKEIPHQDGKTIAYLEANLIGKVQECQGHWCKVEFKDVNNNGSGKSYKGWLPRQAIWGVYLHETKM